MKTNDRHAMIRDVLRHHSPDTVRPYSENALRDDNERGAAVDMTLLQPQCWTPDLVRTAFVLALRLWHRSDAGVDSFASGSWGSDAPWHLMVREVHRGDWDARGVDGQAVAPTPAALSREQIDLRDNVMLWMQWVPERDWRLVAVVARDMAARYGERPRWIAVRVAMGVKLGADALRLRHNAAMQRIADRLNTASVSCDILIKMRLSY
jgi:hypothetical protein